jgi:hypothetical protein
MKNSKTIITILVLALSFSLTAQVAPTTGEKVLEVKESYSGEFLQTVSTVGLSDVVVKALNERVPSKLAKYGFTDITITEVGKVPSPENWTNKMAKASGLTTNRAKGEAMLTTAKTYSEISAAINKMYEPDNNEGNWKFQVNFIDNISKNTYKVRINMMYNPQYIIKTSDLVKDLSSQ